MNKSRITKSLVTILAVAVLAIGATGAYFSDTERIYSNTFATGTLDIAGTSNFPLNFTNLAPGGTYTQDVAVHLGGTLPADIYFGLKNESGADLSAVLDPAIYDVDNSTWVAGGQPATYYFDHWTKAAGNVSPDQWRTYRVYVKMDPGAGNTYQNLTNSTEVILYGTQVGAPFPGTAPYLY